MLEIKDLSVRYGKQAPTIEHFNLNMKKGEIISVVGESGSGKSVSAMSILKLLDGNGYIDDVHGWNFFDGNNELCKGSEDDHGTHAAGTIAATRGNGGIAGIADNKYVKIMSLKALGTQYGVGEEKAIIEAIRYAEANGASICNLSFGTTEYYPELEKVMRESKMLFVVSAGNGDAKGIGEDTDQKPDYPSSFDLDNVISVANLMFDGNLAESSNYGAKSVDIAAPGTYIVSTIANSGYGFMTGTSMSTPMVTGAAAFLYSYRTDLHLSDIRKVLLETARRFPFCKKKASISLQTMPVKLQG